MNRRDVIALLWSTIAAVPLTALRGHAAAEPGLDNLIDAHCHIFNGADLPILDFIDDIVISHSPRFRQLKPALQGALLYYVRELAQWIQEQAPGGSSEIHLLERVQSGQARPASRAQLIERERSSSVDLVARLIDIAKRPPRDQLARQSLRGLGAYVPNVIVGLIHQAAFPNLYYAPVKGINDGKIPPRGAQNFFTLTPDQWALPSALGPALYDNSEITGHYLRWMMQFTRHRFELAETLSGMHGNKAQLIAPALVDFSHWLGDDTDLKLDSQIDTMAAVSTYFARKPGGMRVHGYAPFDPLRQALFDAGKDSLSPLGLAQRAITQQGFLGVKLYPPMGFRALDNASIPDGEFLGPSRRQALGLQAIGAKLDDALRRLYRWCEDNEVPILAHAAHSNGQTAREEDRAAPEYWKLAIEEFPKLRVCLAHFGDFEPISARSAKIEDTWEWKIAALIGSKPDSRLYADISYLHAAVAPAEAKRAREMFAQAVAEFGDELRRKLIYGSDWILLAQEPQFSAAPGARSYNRRVVDFLTRIAIGGTGNPKKPTAAFTEGQIDAVFRGNPGRFLGLTADQQANGTRGRLVKFYSDHGLNADWLNSF